MASTKSGTPARPVPMAFDGAVLAAIALLEAGLLGLCYVSRTPFLGVALALGALFFLCAYRWPDIAIGLVLAASPFSLPARLSEGMFVAVPVEPMMFLALGAWAARALGGIDSLPGRSPIILPLVAYVGMAVVSSVWSEHPTASLKASALLAGYVLFGFASFAGRRGHSDPNPRWIQILAVTGAFWGVYGVLRVVALGATSRAGYGIGRPFFAEHGTYSAFLGILTPWILLEALERRGMARIGYLLAFLAVLAAALLSFTRAAWVALAVVLPVTLVLWAHRRGSLRRILMPALCTIALGLAVIGTGLGDRLSRHAFTVVDSTNVSNLERLNRWLAGWEMVRAHPWRGIGYEAFSDSYRDYRRKTIVTQEAYRGMGVHSEPLRALAEMGILGFAAGAWLVFAIAVSGWRTFRRGSPARSRAALGITAGLATYLVHGMFNSYSGSEKVGLLIWMGVGAVIALCRPSDVRLT